MLLQCLSNVDWGQAVGDTCSAVVAVRGAEPPVERRAADLRATA